MIKDNQLTSLILLAVLGYFIYILCGPSTEKFSETKQENNEERLSSQDETVQPEIMPEINADDILAESEKRMGPGESNVKDLSIYNYEGNDQRNDSGASLDNAFEKPLPDSVDKDVVDINRNNVKKYNAKDFLPKELNNEWFDTDFSQAKYKMNDDKLINTEKYVVGVNTVGQSQKIASYDIRGYIHNPKFAVSPWNNSTVEPDWNLKPLC